MIYIGRGFNVNKLNFITVNDATCIKSAKLKTWQHVSATTSHNQTNNRTKSWYIQWMCTLWTFNSFFIHKLSLTHSLPDIRRSDKQ